MIKKYIVLLFISTLVISCSSTEKFTNTKKTEDTKGFSELEWEGSYTGTEECNTCKNISKTVTLYADETFEVTMEYIGANKPLIERYTGDFKWGMDGKLHLLPDNGNNIGVRDYLIAHDILIPVNDLGHPHTGGFSMLKKQSIVTIYGKKWTLTELYGVKIDNSGNPEMQNAFINFDNNGGAFGNSSCNSFSGQFNMTNGQLLEFDAIASTRKACQEMNTENKFLNMLENTKSYELNNGDLHFLDSAGNILGKFESLR